MLQDPHEGPQWSHLVLENFIGLHSLQADCSFLTVTLSSMFVIHWNLRRSVRVFLSSVILSKSWCMWWTFRALNFLKHLSFLQADSMSNNCFKGLEVVGEKCPSLAWNADCSLTTILFLSISLPLAFQLGCTLWETAGGQADLENLGLILHGECVSTAHLCTVAWEQS